MICPVCNAECPENAEKCESCGYTFAEYTKDIPYVEAEKIEDEKTEIGDTFDAADVSSGKVIAILMYFFPILLILPFIVDSMKTPYLRFHANINLIIFIAEIICGFLSFTVVVPLILGVLALMWAIMGVIAAIRGTTKPLPLIGKINIIK